MPTGTSGLRRTRPRPTSAFDAYASDPARISDIVRFDLPLLGDVSGVDGLHLQCHIGSDTVSLARLGARMTGLDFSPASLAEARRLADLAGVDVPFIAGEVYEAVDLLGRSRFDLVYTGIGALCWMPDITRWADVVATLLRPGGRLFLREAHPIVWALDDARSGDRARLAADQEGRLERSPRLARLPVSRACGPCDAEAHLAG